MFEIMIYFSLNNAVVIKIYKKIPSVHSFILYTAYLTGSQDASLTQGTIAHTHAHTMDNLETSLDRGRKPKYLERTPEAWEENANSKLAWWRWELSGKCEAKNQAAMHVGWQGWPRWLRLWIVGQGSKVGICCDVFVTNKGYYCNYYYIELWL